MRQTIPRVLAIVAGTAMVCFCFYYGLFGTGSIPCTHRNLVEVGMRSDEVKAAIGEPRKVIKHGETEYWDYPCDHGWGIVSIVFDKNGQVSETWILD